MMKMNRIDSAECIAVGCCAVQAGRHASRLHHAYTSHDAQQLLVAMAACVLTVMGQKVMACLSGD